MALKSPWNFEEGKKNDDWITKDIVITTIRPQEGVELSSQVERPLLAHVKLGKHAKLKAKVILFTITRSKQILKDIMGIAEKFFPKVLHQNLKSSESYDSTTNYGSDLGSNVLRLDNVQNPEAVTPETPLILKVETPLGEGEQILPLVYDGDFFLPLGWSRTHKDFTEIVIEELPESQEIRER